MFVRKRCPKPTEALLSEISSTKQELETAYSHFENAIDPDLITSCIYRINSIQERYKYLLKQLKAAETHE